MCMKTFPKKNGNIYLPFCWELFLTSTIFNDWFITVPSVYGSIKFRAKWFFYRLKIYLEIFNLAVDLPKDIFNIIANIFHYHNSLKPGLQQFESISNTFGTYHNQGFVYLSTRHASGYIEKRIGNLMNSTINWGSRVTRQIKCTIAQAPASYPTPYPKWTF